MLSTISVLSNSSDFAFSNFCAPENSLTTFRCVEDIISHLTEFSFSSAIRENSRICDALRIALPRLIEYIQSTSFVDLNMKTANSISSIALGESIDKINRKKEERLIFEAAFIMLACMCRSSIQLTFTEVEFLESYPNYSYNVLGSSEFKSLLRFRNIVKIGMHLIPPVKNKDHLIDLVTRLVEGKLVKHISGSGATKETQRRTNIILTEGNLTINKRPPRKVVDSDAAASGDDDEITITKKRKSQTGEHAQQKLAKKSSEKGEKPPKRRYKKRSASPVSFPPSIMYSSAAVLPGSPTAKVTQYSLFDMMQCM